ncbi:right-handed parallel beta-helix repeat-containing protein [Planctomonas deserti]|uniref:right-handed parallel beta-helix repeat-containing protein n=1 Tax=Planctomonas deserti TaxID=2144185 RepID=UPI00131F14B1|nr:right-handed parallel beta-helix repeat-containing protein [Planctomonas deserti]
MVRVATSVALAAALERARPGQCIQLADGLYLGRFASAASGTRREPITLSGTRNAVLSTGTIESGYGLHLTGSHWIVRGISVTESAKGIVLDGSTHTVIRGVDVGNIGAEGVHFRAGSSDGVIEDSAIHDTGLHRPGFGEGVYIGSARGNWQSVTGSAAVPDRSDRVIVRNNRISNTSAEGVDAKEGTTGGSITGNVFLNAGHPGVNFADSWVDIKGNGYVVSGNSGSSTRRDAFQVHGVLPGWGLDNVFSENVVEGGVPGYEVWVQSNSLGTVIAPGRSGAACGMSNVRGAG